VSTWVFIVACLTDSNLAANDGSIECRAFA
jgi:hypothetical protein